MYNPKLKKMENVKCIICAKDLDTKDCEGKCLECHQKFNDKEKYDISECFKCGGRGGMYPCVKCGKLSRR